MVRVSLTLQRSDRAELEFPAGSRVELGGSPIDAGQARGNMLLARDGWFLIIPAAAPYPLSAFGDERPGDGSGRAGSFVSQAAALRARRLLLSEIGRMAKLERAAWHILLNGRRLPIAAGRVVVEPPPGAAQGIRMGRQAYRGRIEVFLKNDRLLVVNSLPLGDYLYSVVGAEIPSSWHPEALKAQAVAARTYAIKRLGAEGDYDICDSPACQAYGGIATESASTRLAVEETAGVIAVYDGRPIDAVYSANMGGHTTAAEDVWGNSVPYLKAVPSPTDSEALKSPWGAGGYVWEKVLSADDLAASLRRRGYAANRIIDIRVTRRSVSGAVTEIEVTADPEALVFRRDLIRTILGVNSTNLDVRVDPGSERRLISPSVGAARHYAKLGTPLADGRRSIAFDAAPGGIRLVGGSVFMRSITEPARIVINGRGLGHGVGMSQWGAQGMAEQGKTFEQILRHYYTGINLVQGAGAAVSPS